MEANTTEVKIVSDTGERVTLEVTGFYTDTTNTDTLALDPSTLRFAGDSTCIVNFERIQYTASLSSGYVIPYYVGTTSNSVIATFGSGSGEFTKLGGNSATDPTGNVNVQVYNATSGDSFTLLMTGVKAVGYDSRNDSYNN
jgi:hypothetical protein